MNDFEFMGATKNDNSKNLKKKTYSLLRKIDRLVKLVIMLPVNLHHLVAEAGQDN